MNYTEIVEKLHILAYMMPDDVEWNVSDSKMQEIIVTKESVEHWIKALSKPIVPNELMTRLPEMMKWSNKIYRDIKDNYD